MVSHALHYILNNKFNAKKYSNENDIDKTGTGHVPELVT
jgi:hypothetical protein